MLTLEQEPTDRAAAAWIIADEIMRARTGIDDRAYHLWRDHVLVGLALTERDAQHIELYITPVFEANNLNGVTGYVGEWLWYLLTRDLPPEPGRSVEILDPPKSAVNDGGPDGLVVHRVPGSELGFVFRLWEMKKVTGDSATPAGTIRKAWKQLNTHGARYMGQFAWGGRELAPDARMFVASMARQWVDRAETGGGGVSITLNAAEAPDTAFETAHAHFTTHTHPGALQGLMVAVDKLDDFAQQVRRFVWTGL
ncbi:hypothetical protein [Kitasatospora griseola]|uniref:hypothetical protein n=1 Tax=Kitasatospora griseola TaxID=2064 RepID=UPI0037FE8DA1